ncbi:MAG: transcriptional repressor LexA [Acidimicrobiia bacterium]|nr:transcriptional repressor LexA [Acidimicrobiia bacterium]
MAETKHRAGLTSRQKEVLEFIDENLKDKGYPPSVREIAKALNLKSPATVQNHLTTLESKGFLKRDPTKPRAIEMSYESGSGAIAERRPVKHIPLIGSVSAGTGVLADQTIDESYPLPEDFTGDGVLFMLKVRGESMIDAGIFDGDYVVVRQQNTANSGDIVVAGINDDEATIKTFIKKDRKIILRPSNPSMSDVVLKEYNLKIFGKVVTVLRRI